MFLKAMTRRRRGREGSMGGGLLVMFETPKRDNTTHGAKMCQELSGEVGGMDIDPRLSEKTEDG